MKKEDCYYLGKITKPNGYNGGLNIYLDVDDPYEYKNLDAVFIEQRDSLIPYFIKKITVHNSKNTAVVYLEDVEDMEMVQLLINRHLYLPLKSLPPLSGNKFYFHEVTDFNIIDKDKGLLGACKQIFDYPNQALFQVFHGEKEILIPISDDIIKNVDRSKKEIHVVLPEGLLDVYLEDE